MLLTGQQKEHMVVQAVYWTGAPDGPEWRDKNYLASHWVYSNVQKSSKLLAAEALLHTSLWELRALTSPSR